MTNSFVLYKPEQIETYRIIATRKGLELELMAHQNGWSVKGVPTRGMALGSARRILRQYEILGPHRTRKQCLTGMRQLCQELGIAPSRKEQEETDSPY